MYAIRSYYECVTCGHMFDLQFLPRLKSLIRITSYNVCYTKLLRVPPVSTFVRPIHLLPLFTQKQFRPNGYPWTDPAWTGDVAYGPGVCPVVEDLYENSLFTISAIYPPLTERDMDDIVDRITSYNVCYTKLLRIE